MRHRGQALVELAVCLPVVLLLGLGAAGVVQVADAAAGLRAATEAAVDAAARAPDAMQAQSAAFARFRALVAAYPVKSAVLHLTTAGFTRGDLIVGSATATVDLGWESMSVLRATVPLSASAQMRAELWRTRA